MENVVLKVISIHEEGELDAIAGDYAVQRLNQLLEAMHASNLVSNITIEHDGNITRFGMTRVDPNIDMNMHPSINFSGVSFSGMDVENLFVTGDGQLALYCEDSEYKTDGGGSTHKHAYDVLIEWVDAPAPPVKPAENKPLTVHDIECAVQARMEWLEQEVGEFCPEFRELKLLQGFILCGDPYPPYAPDGE